jgi:cytochrome c oxidase subunit 4
MSHAEHAPATADPRGENLAHPVPAPFMVKILLALLVLTVITVVVSYIELGNANLFVAMIVASIKASLVALFFMHLRWDKPFNGLILIGSFLFLGIFIGFALLDTKEYQHELQPMFEAPPQQLQFDPPPTG